MKEPEAVEQEASSNSPDKAEKKEGGNSTPGSERKTVGKPSKTQNPAERLIVGGAWLVAISLVLLVIYLVWQSWAKPALASSPEASQAEQSIQAASTAAPGQVPLATPALIREEAYQAVFRQSRLHTIIPARPREDVITYTVDAGDSVFGIAKGFNLLPETVLWANYDTLKDSPDMLSPGMVLNIPPANGVYYTWKEGDTLDGVAGQFKAKAEDILSWPGNHLDLVSPEVKPGQSVLIPGGKREFVQWIIPTIPRGRAGVSRSVYGPGACEGGYEGAYGTGTFIWPSGNHFLSGNDFWSGHLGIDIAGATGDGIFASDSGVIVFSGWATGGYGYMIMIDHGNGYQSLYGHLSAVSARCGQSVFQGGYIGAMGSTGNSTGSHLHFEIRYGGGFINPWSMLPPP